MQTVVYGMMALCHALLAEARGENIPVHMYSDLSDRCASLLLWCAEERDPLELSRLRELCADVAQTNRLIHQYTGPDHDEY